MRFGIIGAGNMGRKRAHSIIELGHPVHLVCDWDEKRASLLCGQFGGKVHKNPSHVIRDSGTEAVVISTPPEFSVSLAIEALRSKKPVFIEKPAGRNPKELSLLLHEASQTKVPCCIGFNHRFHPGLRRAKEMTDSGELGELLYFRARYGHGGRLGYEKEWRASPKIGGGGELLDQGVHLIDLCRWMGGEFELEYGKAFTAHWQMPVEDNGLLVLRSSHGKQLALLHASCTEWKNIFDFEIFFNMGKIQVVGLGGSYGREELRIFRRKNMGPPDSDFIPFANEDTSWKEEIVAFLDEIKGVKTQIATPQDAFEAVRIVYQVYERCGLLHRY